MNEKFLETPELSPTGITPPEHQPRPTGESPESEMSIQDLLATMDSVRQGLIEVVPPDRNFDIDIQETKDEAKIILRSKELGIAKDISSWLPPGHTIKPGDAFTYWPKGMEITYKREEVPYRGFLLSLMHEIGHAHQQEHHQSATNSFEDFRAFWEGLVTVMTKTWQASRAARKRGEMLPELPTEYFLPPWYVDKKREAKAGSERNAWAYALRQLRQLEREGYDVFAGFNTNDQIKAYIAYCLLTYDIDDAVKVMINRGLHDQKATESPKPIFWSKRKKLDKREPGA